MKKILIALFAMNLFACSASVTVDDAAVAAADGAGGGSTVTYNNFLVVNDGEFVGALQSAEIYYWEDERCLLLNGPDFVLRLYFMGVADSEIPAGAWTDFSAEGVSTVRFTMDNEPAYDITAYSPTGTIVVAGDDSEYIDITGTINWADDGQQSMQFHFTGDYTYAPD